MSILLQLGENPGLSNTEYHSELEHLSSSNLKLILENPEQFYQEKVLRNKPPQVEKPHFILGSFVHSLVLEPHLIDKEYAFFPGWRKAGNDYQAFVQNNPGKVIISAPQKNTGELLARAVQAKKSALALLEGGVAELSLAHKILDVPVKMRADYLNLNKNYIVDVKTTSQPTDTEIFRQTVFEFGYGLSAALYCQIAFNVYGRVFDFYWVVISKSDLSCQVYKASSNTLSTGAAEVLKALVLYKKCKETGIWTLQNEPEHGNVDTDEVIEI